MAPVRDTAGWIREVERMGVRLRGIPQLVAQSTETIREEVEETNNRHPAAPIELTFQTAFYTDTTSRKRVRFLLDFPDVVFNTDGTPATIQQYELWGRDITASKLAQTTSAVPAQAAPGVTLPGLASTPTNQVAEANAVKPWAQVDTSTISAFRTEGFIPGSVWEFRARAIGAMSTMPGEWSETVTAQMLADKTPPPMPSAPVLTVSRGTITATWDGQAVTGAMPADFKYAVLAHGDASSPTMEIARFGRGGGFKIVADLEYYDPQFFRLQAVDESGNRSPWSEQAVGYTVPLVDRDVILSTIDAAKTHLKNINAGVSILPNTIITEHLVVTEEMTAAIANFLEVNADMINANSIWADEGWFGLADALLFRGDAFEGRSFTGGVFTGGRFQNTVEEYSGFKIDETGILGYAPGGTGVETFRLDAATGSLTVNSGTLTGLKYQTHLAANTGIKIDAAGGFKAYDGSNRLAVDIGLTSTTFTGTVQSGFGAAKARIGEGVFIGRPGLQIVTGSGYYAEPFAISFPATDPAENRRGAMYISAAWMNASANPSRMLLSENGDISIGSWKGSYFVGTDYAQIAWSDRRMHIGWNMYLSNNSGGSIELNGDNTITLGGTGTTIYGGLNVSGSKNFVMDHPTKPGMELLHGATESPVSGVQYWGCAQIGPDGTALVELPEYFEALVKPGTACIGVNGNGAVVGWDMEVVDNSFTVTGPAGTWFRWDVTAERFGADFPVEREKVEWVPPGSVAE